MVRNQAGYCSVLMLGSAERTRLRDILDIGNPAVVTDGIVRTRLGRRKQPIAWRCNRVIGRFIRRRTLNVRIARKMLMFGSNKLNLFQLVNIRIRYGHRLSFGGVIGELHCRVFGCAKDWGWCGGRDRCYEYTDAEYETENCCELLVHGVVSFFCFR